jgi:hypothetical protein
MKKFRLQYLGAVLIAALFIAFIFWLGRKSGQIGNLEKPEKVTEVRVLIKDSLETQILRRMLIDLRAEFEAYRKQSERTKKFFKRKIQQNENFKTGVVEWNDTIVDVELGRILTRYDSILKQRANKLSDLRGL